MIRQIGGWSLLWIFSSYSGKIILFLYIVSNLYIYTAVLILPSYILKLPNLYLKILVFEKSHYFVLKIVFEDTLKRNFIFFSKNRNERVMSLTQMVLQKQI